MPMDSSPEGQDDMGKDFYLARTFTPAEPAPLPEGLADLLAEQAARAVGLDEVTAGRVAAAALNPDRFEAEEALISCLDDGIAPEALIDLYIPFVASLFGECWARDRLSFAEVTICVARMQGHVRMLDQRIPRPAVNPMHQPSVLLVVAPTCFHTLGPMVALSRFRRLGASVRLLLAQGTGDVAAALDGGDFDMVALSASGSEKLDTLRMLVDVVRKSSRADLPVVIGGSIVDAEPDTHILVGADHSAREPEEALNLCGLKMPTSAASTRARGT